MNRGIKFSLQCLGADCVALLNNDISVSKDFLVAMLKAFNHVTIWKYIGIVGPRVLDFYTGIEVEQPQIYIPLQLILFIQRFFRTLAVSSKAYRTYNYISVNRLNGCCYLVMSKVFNDVGFLKEEYFVYWEDSDFFLRVKKKGYLIVFAPVSVVRHKIGGANIRMRRINPRASYYFARNMINFIKFNYSGLKKYIVYLGAILSLPVYLCINLCYYHNIQEFKCFLFGFIKGILGETEKSI
ncbi:MAG: glycosyltransferase family 2 protein [Pyrobaculum sp.]|jgi:GT2 family glycosyltransferase